MTIEIDNKKMFLAHGDEATNAVFVKALKLPFIYAVMDALGPSLTWKVAMACRIFLSKRRRIYSQKVRDAFRVYAKRKLDEGYDAVILAHTHIADLIEYEDGPTNKTYLNTGDLIANMTYGDYTTSGGFAVRTYEQGGG